MTEEQQISDTHWMRMALDLAAQSAAAGEVPVAAVLVNHAGDFMAGAHNAPIAEHDPSAHAEIRVLRAAASLAKNYRLTGSTLYVTLEPCIMCVGAILHARVSRVVYGAVDPKAGAVESLYHLLDDQRFNHHVQAEGGLLAEESAILLRDFFRARRAQQKGKA